MLVCLESVLCCVPLKLLKDTYLSCSLASLQGLDPWEQCRCWIRLELAEDIQLAPRGCGRFRVPSPFSPSPSPADWLP